MRAVSVAGAGSTRSGRHDGTAIDDSGDPSSRPCPQGRVPRHVSRDSRSGNDPGLFPPDVVEARSRPEPSYLPVEKAHARVPLPNRHASPPELP